LPHLPKALQSGQKAVSGPERDDEARYVDDYASIGEKKQVDRYWCNYWIDEEGTREEMYSNAL
jgi:hypothetical protein